MPFFLRQKAPCPSLSEASLLSYYFCVGCRQNLTESGCGAQRDRIQNGEKNLIDTGARGKTICRRILGRQQPNITLKSAGWLRLADQQAGQDGIPLIRCANLDSLRATRLR